MLITGASSGFGEQFARQFAARGHDVTLVARREQRLTALAEDIRARCNVDATVLVADLATGPGIERVADALRATGGAWVLVNNAGFGSRGRFAALDADRERDEVMVNVAAAHRLTSAVLPGNVAARAGGVINVASTAAFQPLPYMATYGATKAFLLHFTEALAVELEGTGVRMLALCPGPARTEFGSVAGNSAQLELRHPMSAEAVVRSGIRAFDRGRTVCIPGAVNVAGAMSVRFVPRAAARRITGRIFAPR